MIKHSLSPYFEKIPLRAKHLALGSQRDVVSSVVDSTVMFCNIQTQNARPSSQVVHGNVCIGKLI